MAKFNEDSRVKIPSILHLMRLGYDYLSLKDPRIQWDETTNIFTDIFKTSIAQINQDISDFDIEKCYDEVSLCLKNEDLGKFIENITVIEKDLVSIFEKNKIRKIDTQKKKFDPNLHQAMSEIENMNVEAGMILQEVQAGYMFGDRLLRPALVSVAKKKVSKSNENEEKKEDK